MATLVPPGDLDLQEQIARIRKHMADTDKAYDEILKMHAETDKVRIESRIAPWQAVLGGATAAGALIAATATVIKIFS